MGQSASPFIPYGRQSIDDDDIEAVVRVLRSSFLTTGPEVAAFEEAFAKVTGAAYAVACSSGTAALHLAMLAFGLGEGDVVVVPSITFLATANAVRMVGAEVVFADVDPITGMLTPATARAALEQQAAIAAKRRVIVPVHLNGHLADLDGLAAVASDYNAEIVEDACHALGGSTTATDGKTVPVGVCGLSKMTAFSLHPVKPITMGEGGVVTTADAGLLQRLRGLRNHGMIRAPDAFANPEDGLAADGAPHPWYYEMRELGFNYRATDMQCALGRSQLKKLEAFRDRRCDLARLYDAALSPLVPNVEPVPEGGFGRSGWHLYAVKVDFASLGVTRDELIASLRDQGIGTQVHYYPVHRQPYYRGRYGEIELAGANAYYESQLSLPLFPSMRDCDPGRVVGALARGLLLNKD